VSAAHADLSISGDGIPGWDCESSPGPYWEEGSGLTGFDASRALLISLTSGQSLKAVVRGGGPYLWDEDDVRPLLRVDMTATGLFADGWRPGRYPLELFSPRPTLEEGSYGRWRHATGLLIQLPGGFTLTERVIIDSDRVRDPTARLKEYRQLDASVEVPHAVLAYRNGPLLVDLGRTWRRWGPGWTGSLLLGDAHAPGDGVDLAYTRARWSARFFCERLDDIPPDEESASGRHRYLAGHRLDLQPRRNLRLGLSEIALVATEDGLPFWLCNPLLPWVLVQQEHGREASPVNVLGALDAVWKPAPHWTLYGQLLLDDMQIDSEDRDVYPDQLGWLAGLLWDRRPPVNMGRPEGPPRTASGPSAGLEYSRIATWTYVHRQPAVRYEAWSAPLGHPDGPDAETVSAFGEWRFPGRLHRVLLLARWQRSGRITLDTPEISTGQAGGGFPSPPVRQSVLLGGVCELKGPAGTRWEARVSWLAEDGELRDGWFGALAATLPLGPWRWTGF
jgi:hypothetical protein